MSQQEFKTEDFSLFLDGRMSPEDQDRLRRRFREDPELYSTFLQFRTATEMVRAARNIKKLPSTFDARLRERIKVDQIRQRARQRVHAEEGRYTFAQKLTLAATGVAAGIALVLGLMPFLSDANVETIVIESTTSSVTTLPVGGRVDPVRLVESGERGIDSLRRSFIRLRSPEIPSVVIQSELRLVGLSASIFDRAELLVPAGENLNLRLEKIRRVLFELERLSSGGAGSVDRDAVLKALKGEAVPGIFLEGRGGQLPVAEDVIAFKALRRMASEASPQETSLFALCFLREHANSELYPFVVRSALDSLQGAGRPDVAFRLLKTMLERGPAGLGEVSLCQLAALESALTSLPATGAANCDAAFSGQRTIRPDAPGSISNEMATLIDDFKADHSSGIDAFERQAIMRRLRQGFSR